jgi:hypothetical protein
VIGNASDGTYASVSGCPCQGVALASGHSLWEAGELNVLGPGREGERDDCEESGELHGGYWRKGRVKDVKSRVEMEVKSIDKRRADDQTKNGN